MTDAAPAAGPSGDPAPALFVRFYRAFPSAPDRADATADAEETGKFVILSRGRDLHLVLSPVAFTPYHANIVQQYLQAEGRGRVESASSSGCRILSPEWAVHGGGYFTFQHWLHHLRLHGKSSAFGKYDAARLDPFRDAIPGELGFAGYTLELE
jgi:hypothetical protein